MQAKIKNVDDSLSQKLIEIGRLEEECSPFGISFAVRGEWGEDGKIVTTEDAVDYVIEALKRSAELSNSIESIPRADRQPPK